MTFLLQNWKVHWTLAIIISIYFRLTFGIDGSPGPADDGISFADSDPLTSQNNSSIPKSDRTQSLSNVADDGVGAITSLVENLNLGMFGDSIKDKDKVQTVADKLPTKEPFDSSGIVDSINGIKTDLDKLSNSFNIFKIIDTFIDQWRHSLPILATKAHFTWLQAALLCAVGSIAAGAAIIAAEAFYFKTQKDDEEYAHAYADYYHQHYASKLPSLTYGRRNSDDTSAPKMSPAQKKYYNEQWKRLNKPQSLKRNQRRRQRKNKNAAGAGSMLNSIKKRLKRQITEPMAEPGSIEAASAKHMINSFNEFLYSPSNRSSPNQSRGAGSKNSNTSYSYWTRSNQYGGPVETGISPVPLPTISAGQSQELYQIPVDPQVPGTFQAYTPGKYPQPPLRKTDQQSEKEQSPNIFTRFRNAVTDFLNYMFDHGGDGNGSGSAFSRNEPPKSGFYFPKLNPNRNFINRNFNFIN